MTGSLPNETSLSLARARFLALALLLLISPAVALRAADGATMQAIVFVDGHLAMQSVARPEPGPGEVRIRIRAAAINPADWKMARMASRFGPDPIFGLDASGIIDAVGPSVTGWKSGDAVVALTRPPHGAYAQYAVVSVDFIAPKPRSLSFEQAAGIPVAGITAWRSLIDVAQLRSGQRVLIDGGAGGVGSAAVQIAKARGAYVIATASASNASFLKSIGADEVIDYTAGPFEQKVKDVDVALDTVSPEDGLHAMSTLKPGGILVSIVGKMPEDRCAAAKIRCAIPGSSGGQPATPYLREVGKLADAGKYRVNVERVLPLSEAAQAWALNQQGHTRGKLVLSVSG
jgi:NADPH:quinone reductase-like Zn-dependent oxidoreductase